MPKTLQTKRIAIQQKDPIDSRDFWKASLRKQYSEQEEFTEVGQKNTEENSLEETTDSKLLRQERVFEEKSTSCCSQRPKARSEATTDEATGGQRWEQTAGALTPRAGHRGGGRTR